jgi:hypothetical protein
VRFGFGEAALRHIRSNPFAGKEGEMGILKVLMLYNFSVRDSKSLDFVVNAFAKRDDVKITIFNIYIPAPEVDTSANPEMKKMRTGLAYLEEECRRRESGLKASRSYLVENGFDKDQVDYALKKKERGLAEDIIAKIVEGRYRVLVMRPTKGKVGRLFNRGFHEKMIQELKGVDICIPT